MSCLYTYKGITMNQQQLFDSIMEEILGDTSGEKYKELRSILFKTDMTQDEAVKKLEQIAAAAKGKTYRAIPGKTTETGWIGISEYMDLWHDLGKLNHLGKNIDSLLYPVYNPESRIDRELIIRIEALRQISNPEERRTIDEIKEDIAQQLEDELLGAQVGTMFHNIVGAILEEGGGVRSTKFQLVLQKTKKDLISTTIDGVKYSKTVYDVMRENNPSLTELDMIDILVDRATRLAGKIKSEHLGARFFSEIAMCTPDVVAPKDADGKPIMIKGLRGRSDLVIVDPDGTTTILDFKVATRHYEDWCAAKKYHTEYLLGFYRHILAANGFDGSKIKLQIAPVYMERGDMSKLEFSEKNTLINAIRDSLTRDRASRLDWDQGSFTDNIRKMVNIPFKISPMESSELLQEIDEKLASMITYKPKEHNYNKQDFVDNYVRPELVNGKIEYVFYDWTNGNKRIAFDSKEEFIKDGGFVDLFNERARKLTRKQVDSVIEDIEEARKKGTKQSDLNFLSSKNSNSDVAKHLTAAFGVYTGVQYELIDAPILMDNGIIAYENTSTHTIYFEVLTDLVLSAKVDNNGLTTVLGNHYSNDEVRRLKGIDAMDANCGNMELIKAIHVINMLYDKYPEKFANKKIGLIEVVNSLYGQRRSVDLELLKANYSVLAHKTGVTNHFSSGQIETADLWEAMIADVNKAIIDTENDPDLKQCLSGLKGNTQLKSERIRQIETAIKKMKRRYSDLRYVDFKKARTYDLDNPIHIAYLAMVETYNYLLGIPITYNGEISRWGAHFGEVIKILTLPFIKDLANTLNNGYQSKGLGTGIETTSPQTVPSATLRALYQYYDIAFIEVRLEYSKARSVINRITAPYINSKQSMAFKAMVGVKYSIWENLLVKDAEGKISDTLMLRNPYTDKTLSKEDADFLKAILWEINKYKPSLNLSDELKSLNYLDDKDKIEAELKTNAQLINAFEKNYFELPLRRASDFLRLKNVGRMGIGSYFTKKLKQGRDEYDPRLLHATRNNQLNNLKKDSCEMFNLYDISPKDRLNLILQEGVYDFEIDLDYLVSDVAFQAIRQNYFEKVLLMTDTVATALHLVLQTTDRSHAAEIEGMDDLANVLKGNSLIKEELQDLATGIGALKRFNSLVVLAIRPVLFIKELTFGQITNYSRAWALKGTSNAISAKSVFNANKVIWGLSLSNYGSGIFGNGDLADYTMCEALNKVYGFANEDLNRTVENSVQRRKGIVQNGSKYMYIANSAPDYFNRLTLLVAKMMEDDCWEAHSLNDDGTLKYDFTKDKRFSELKLDKDGYIITPTSKKGLEQLGLYRAMADDFEREHIQLISVIDGKEKLKPLPRAYTINQRNSIKEVADLAYGFYDHEAKSLMDHKFIGLVWKQFMTFWTAKVQLWFRGKPMSPGDNTSQGRFVLRTENGEKLWRRVEEEANGKLVVYEVKDSELRPDEIGKLEPCVGWQGDYSEGLIYSVMGALYDVFHFDFKHLASDKVQLANVKLALHDILIGTLLYALLKWIFSGGTNKMKNIKPTEKILLRAMNDVGPQSITSMNWEPGFYTTMVNTKNDILKLLNSDSSFVDMATKRIGAVKDFTWEEAES